MRWPIKCIGVRDRPAAVSMGHKVIMYLVKEMLQTPAVNQAHHNPKVI